MGLMAWPVSVPGPKADVVAGGDVAGGADVIGADAEVVGGVVVALAAGAVCVGELDVADGAHAARSMIAAVAQPTSIHRSFPFIAYNLHLHRYSSLLRSLLLCSLSASHAITP